MKFILFILLTCTALRAQVPHIDYMIADEAKSQLQIHGTFSSDTTGFVTIENTKQLVRLWSDTMLICDLPDSGAGAGGQVIVQQMGGASNARILSIFKMNFLHENWLIRGQTGDLLFALMRWYLSWRTDIAPNQNNKNLMSFEISKISYGRYTDSYGVLDATFPWTDSSILDDSSISVKGIMNTQNYTVIFKSAYMPIPDNSYKKRNPQFFSISSIPFDTLGMITGYSDYGIDNNLADTIYNLHILFPPSQKDIVNISTDTSSNFIKIFPHLGSEEPFLSFEAEVPLGETIVALYSIDGRLLKQEKSSISSAGIYSFDASGITQRFGILVFKTDKGLFARKVLF